MGNSRKKKRGGGDTGSAFVIGIPEQAMLGYICMYCLSSEKHIVYNIEDRWQWLHLRPSEAVFATKKQSRFVVCNKKH
jgi:hypothetical protein